MELQKAVLYGVAVLSMGATVPAMGSYITFGAAQNISAVTDVDTTGTLVGAYSMVGTYAGSTETVNGVTFVPFPGTSSDTETFSGSYNDYYSASAGLPAAYGAILDYGNDGGSSPVVTINGLTNGDSYEIQVWVSDSDNNPGHGGGTRDATFSGDAGGGTPVTLDYYEAATEVGQFAIGDFVASGTSQTLNVVGGNYNGGSTGVQINAFQIRDLSVPEPATLGLLGAGLALGLVRRRRTGQRP